MKLKTSFFKPVTLKKDILRFAPIWALYLIGMLLILMETGSYNDYDNYGKLVIPGLITAFGIVNLCYAALCANLLFGDLYNTKLCYSLHAMPYRRESWLCTHLLSGLLFSLVPNLIACAYMMWRLDAYWFLALYWYLAATLQFLFFYGIAAVSAMLTGNRFAMLLVYAGFNFVAMLLYATIDVVYLPILTGVVADLEAFTQFSPVVQLFRYDFFTFTRINVFESDIYSGSKYFYRFDGLASGWGYTAILGCVGLAAMGIALWLYRIRQLESAGDFVAFPKLKGIACVIMTLCVSLCFALVGQAFDSYTVWLFVGLIIGFFGSLMLLERRLKVFRKKTFLGFVAMVLGVSLSLLAIHCDWLGIESWTPRADRVASVTVSNRNRYEYYYYYDYLGNLEVTLEDPADIERIIAAHEDILDRLNETIGNGGNRHRVTLTYKMKSGRTVVRSYAAPASGKNYEIVRQYLYQADSLLGFTNAKEAAKSMAYMYCAKGQVPEALYETVLEALQRDCAKGQVLPDSAGEYYFEYEFTNSEGNTVRRYVVALRDAAHISALMQSPELLMGYADWEEFLTGIQKLVVEDGSAFEVTQAQQRDLLTALRKDIEAGTVQHNEMIADAILLYYEVRYPGGGYEYREFCITEKAQNVQTWLKENLYTPAG